jgi:hypothetical protein
MKSRVEFRTIVQKNDPVRSRDPQHLIMIVFQKVIVSMARRSPLDHDPVHFNGYTTNESTKDLHVPLNTLKWVTLS